MDEILNFIESVSEGFPYYSSLDPYVWLNEASSCDAVVLFISMYPLGITKFLLIGQVYSICIRNAGASHHDLLLTKFIVFIPLLR